MPDAVKVNPNSWLNAGYGSTADVNTPSLQRFTPIPRDVYYSGGNLWQQSLPCENTQALISSRYVFGENGTAALSALEVSDDTINDSRTTV